MQHNMETETADTTCTYVSSNTCHIMSKSGCCAPATCQSSSHCTRQRHTDTKRLDASGAQEQHCKGSWPLFLGQQCEYAQLQVKSHISRPSQLNAAPVQFRQGCSCSRPRCQDTQLPETSRHVTCQSGHKPPYSRIPSLFTKLKAQRKHSPPSFPARLILSITATHTLIHHRLTRQHAPQVVVRQLQLIRYAGGCQSMLLSCR